MKEYRVIILDAELDYANYLADCLSQRSEFKVLAALNDGAQALDWIRSRKPDLVLMDLILPGLDGLCLLKAMRKLKNPPVAVCHSSFFSDVSVEAARRSGASYYVYKPLTSDALASILLECAQAADELRQTACSNASPVREQKMRHTHEILHRLGFSPKYSGYAMLAESVELAMESPMFLRNLSTGLYRRMAEMRHTSPAAIERSIRTVIDAANRSGALTAAMGCTPTNKTCIQFILRLLNSPS